MYVSVCVIRWVGVVDRPTNSGAGRSRGHAADDSDSEDEASFQSYDDHDDGESPVPPFEQLAHLAFNSLDTTQGAPSPRLILFLNFFLLIV